MERGWPLVQSDRCPPKKRREPHKGNTVVDRGRDGSDRADHHGMPQTHGHQKLVEARKVSTQSLRQGDPDGTSISILEPPEQRVNKSALS